MLNPADSTADQSELVSETNTYPMTSPRVAVPHLCDEMGGRRPPRWHKDLVRERDLTFCSTLTHPAPNRTVQLEASQASGGYERSTGVCRRPDGVACGRQPRKGRPCQQTSLLIDSN
jgi:hypothetical protein